MTRKVEAESVRQFVEASRAAPSVPQFLDKLERRHRALEAEMAGRAFTLLDEREDYGEDRYQTVGLLDDQLVMVVWTPRGEDRRVISMRKCNEREKARFQARLPE
jgi:uncharacterized protein